MGAEFLYHVPPGLISVNVKILMEFVASSCCVTRACECIRSAQMQVLELPLSRTCTCCGRSFAGSLARAREINSVF